MIVKHVKKQGAAPGLSGSGVIVRFHLGGRADCGLWAYNSVGMPDVGNDPHYSTLTFRRVLYAVVLGTLAASVFTSSAGAQRRGESTASVTASVVDAAGAAWVRADVALIDTRTLEDKRGITDEKGVVHFNRIKPGNYVLIAAPHPPIDCADSGIKQFTLKPSQSLDARLTVRVEHCGVVE